jgi:hypothetical protein
MRRAVGFRSVLIRSFMILIVTCVALSSALHRASANPAVQTTAPKKPVVCPCVNDAIVMLDKYGIPFNALASLLPLFNDKAKLTATLSKYKLTAAQITALQTEAKALIKKGLTAGRVKQFAVVGAQNVLKRYKISTKHLTKLLKLTKDKAALEKMLLSVGAKQADLAALEKELSYYFELSLDETAYQCWLSQEAIDFLDYYGISRTALRELMAAFGNTTKLNAFMAKYGITDKQHFEEVVIYLYDYGLNEAALAYYLAQEAYDRLYEAGLLREQIEAALALYEDQAAFEALLAQYGLTPEAYEAINAEFDDYYELGLEANDFELVMEDQEKLEEQVDEELDEDNSGTMDENTDEEMVDDPALEEPVEEDGNIDVEEETGEEEFTEEGGDQPVDEGDTGETEDTGDQGDAGDTGDTGDGGDTGDTGDGE